MTLGGGEQHITFQDSPLSFFAEVLSHSLGRAVVDKTGLEGRYNFNLHWVPDMGMMRMGGPGPMGPGPAGSGPNVAIGSPGPAGPGPAGGGPSGVGASSSSDASGPSLFTALQEQLGLKLQSEKGPVDVLVIDRVEEPSEN